MNEDTRYTFTSIAIDGTRCEVSGNKVVMEEVIEDFKLFLLACSYSSELVNRISLCDCNLRDFDDSETSEV